MKNDPIEMLLDENCDENIVMYNEAGEAFEFEQVALIVLRGNTYALLHPVILEDDSGLVYEIKGHGCEKSLNLVTNDNVVDAVFEEYYRMLDQAEGHV